MIVTWCSNHLSVFHSWDTVVHNTQKKSKPLFLLKLFSDGIYFGFFVNKRGVFVMSRVHSVKQVWLPLECRHSKVERFLANWLNSINVIFLQA